MGLKGEEIRCIKYNYNGTLGSQIHLVTVGLFIEQRRYFCMLG